MRQTNVARLYEDHRDHLQLTHISGNLNARLAVGTDERIWPADLVGHLNFIHPARLQVLGNEEIAWARRQSQEKIARQLNRVIDAQAPAIIIADNCEIPRLIRSLCETANIALFSTPHPSASVIDHLRLYLSRELAETVSLHGVFMDVFGLGVFISGNSGTGKSELALELISRGHGLVADDIIEFSRIAPTVLEGRCPPLLQDYIEARGLGLINIRTIFGETACRRKMRLRLACHLERRQPGHNDPPRLPGQQVYQDILGVQIPRVTLPVEAGRNIAVLIEAAVRVTVLKLRGIDSTQEFIDRHNQQLRENQNKEIS